MTTEPQTQAVVAVNPDASVLDFYTKEQQRILREVIAPGVPEAEFRAYLIVARASGLDPIRRQIYPVMRWDKKLGRERMTIQCGIDGYRDVISSHGEAYQGDVGPFWCGADGKWVDVWLEPGPPKAAKYGTWMVGCKEPFWGVALWASYCQTDKEGRPTQFWTRMGPEMLAKCAEALSKRKAAPSRLSGTYTAEEMSQADREPRDAEVVDDGSKAATPGAQRQAAALSAKAKAAVGAPAAAAPSPAQAPAQPEPAQEPREVEAEVVDQPAQGSPFAAGDKLGTGAVTAADLAAYIDPAQTEGLHEYQVWPFINLGPWDSWKGQKMAEKGPLAQWTAEQFVQGAEGGGRHTIGTDVLEKVAAKYGPETATQGALRLDYCVAVMRRKYDALRLHPKAAAELELATPATEPAP